MAAPRVSEPPPTLRRRAPRRALPAAAAFAWLLASCAGAPETPSSVILISLDTCRSDMLSCYGYPRPTSPAIDRLAREGVLFETALAPAPWTLPSHVSMLTGLYPRNHSVISETRALPESVTPATTILRRRDMATGAIVNSHYLSRRYGLDRDFDHYRYLREDMNAAEPSGVEREAEAWLDEIGGRPFFLFLHFYGPHSDYRSLPRFEEMFARPYDGLVDGSTRQLRAFRDGEFPLGEEDVPHLVDLYVAGIRQVDEEIGRLLDDLETRGLDKTTLVIVTSDHGEEFLEHGGVLHGRTLYEELLRVPLVMRGPGVPEGVRVEEPVSLVDVAPTILSLLGAAPSPADGVDLSALWEDAAAPDGEGRVLFSEADHNNDENDILRAARCGTYKLILDRLTGDATLYDLSRDPEESEDIGDDEPDARKRLAEAIEAHLSASSPEKDLPDLSPEEIEHLKSLGYF